LVGVVAPSAAIPLVPVHRLRRRHPEGCAAAKEA